MRRKRMHRSLMIGLTTAGLFIWALLVFAPVQALALPASLAQATSAPAETPSPIPVETSIPTLLPTATPSFLKVCYEDLPACIINTASQGKWWLLFGILGVGVVIWLASRALDGLGKSIEETIKKKADTLLQPKPQLSSFESDYLKAVIQDWKNFKFRGANLSARDILPPELEKAYVSVRLSPRVKQDEDQEEPGTSISASLHTEMKSRGQMAESPQAVDLGEAFQKSARLAIIGPAGAGKSTLLQWAGLACARARLRENLRTEQQSLVSALGEQPLIPVIVTLRDFNYWCKSHTQLRQRSPEALLTFISQHFAQQHPTIALPEPFFAQALQSGCLLMLDGVDELDEGDRARVGEAIEGLLRDFPNQVANRFLLTSRPTGYFNPGQASDFTRCDVLPLNPPQRNELIADWCNAIYPPDKASLETQELIQRIQETSRLDDLASTPLMVTILALVQKELGRLPHQRAELYEEAIKILLTETYKEGEAVKTLQGWGGRSPEGRRNCLAPIAYELQLVPERRHALRLGDLAGRERVCKAFRSESDARAAAETFIEKVAERGGLLDKAQGEYGFFTHNMFREFLAGRYLAEELEDQWSAILAEKLSEDLWSEVLLLAAGYLAIKSDEKANRYILTLAEAGAKPQEQARALTLACQAIADLPPTSVFLDTRQLVQQTSVELISADPVILHPARVRESLGRALGDIVDPRLRPGALPDLLPVPAGAFFMGTSPEQAARMTEQEINSYDDEKPGHLVQISYDFQVARYPVCNAEYQLFVEEDGYDLEKHGQCWSAEGQSWRRGEWRSDLSVYPEASQENFKRWLERRPVERRDLPFYWDDPTWNRPNQPVVGVTWFEAQAYATWLTRRLHASGTLDSGMCLRLPSEAEWEKAARGADGRIFPWGDQWDPVRCNNREGDDSLQRTSPVGIYPHGASPFGALDMAGNVWEWCQDWFDPEEYSRRAPESVMNPPGPATGKARVVRGGAWSNDRSNARCAVRFGLVPGDFGSHLGFRLVLAPITGLDS